MYSTAASSEMTDHRTSMVSRVMTVLGVFSDSGPRLRAADISRHSGLPSATTHRVLQELLEHGAVSREPGGWYTVGPRLWEIGRLGARMYRLWSVGEPHLRALGSLVGGRAYLTVLAASEGLRLDGTSGAVRDSAPCWVVERIPLHATAGGQVLLAFAGSGVVDRVARAPLTRFTDHTVVAPEPFCRLLDDVRRTGIAVSKSQYRLGQTTVAAPVLMPDAQLMGAVEVVFGHNLPIRLVLPAVRRTADELSRALGASAPSRHRASQTGHIAHPVEISR